MPPRMLSPGGGPAARCPARREKGASILWIDVGLD